MKSCHPIGHKTVFVSILCIFIAHLTLNVFYRGMKHELWTHQCLPSPGHIGPPSPKGQALVTH